MLLKSGHEPFLLRKKRRNFSPKTINEAIKLFYDEMEEKICSDFARYPSKLAKCIEEYNLFFHKLVYHMRYKEHVSIPEEISPVASMRKNEIIADLPALPHISEIKALDEISNLWYFHLEDMIELEAVKQST